MSKHRLLARAALALVFVTGTWEDILPGIDHPLELLRSDDVERTSDVDGEAGDGLVLSQLPLEPVLIAEAGLSDQVSVGYRLLPGKDPDARLPHFLRLILHVPIPAGLA